MPPREKRKKNEYLRYFLHYFCFAIPKFYSEKKKQEMVQRVLKITAGENGYILSSYTFLLGICWVKI
jgi:hypothetical protein